jgi:ABC-type uncharacterized transport system fused permease/ATPase subunit
VTFPRHGIRVPAGDRVAFEGTDLTLMKGETYPRTTMACFLLTGTVTPCTDQRSGEHLCVLGPNGSGKSLFCRALLSESPPGSATMSFDMHKALVGANHDRVVADVLGGASDPLAR